MRTLLIGLALTLGTCSPLKADGDPLDNARDEFEAGIRNKHRVLLARKHFSAAADWYLVSLRDRRAHNTSIYRVLGNSLALADRWPEAIWAYQMGLTFSPNDAEMRGHLHDLQSKVLLPSDGQGRLPPDRWPLWLPRLTVPICWWGGIGFYCIVCFSLAVWSVRPTRAWLTAAIAAFVIAIAAWVGALLIFTQDQSERESPIAIVIENTPFRRGNATSYPLHAAVPTLPRGMQVRIMHQRGDWLQASLSTGETAWLPTDAVRIVKR